MTAALIPIVAALLQATQAAPQRNVPDPGVIATGQRVTPAGVLSAFAGRVGGVRFSRTSDAVWVGVSGAAYRLDWRANRVLTRGATGDRPGVFGVAIDPANGRAFVSSVQRDKAGLSVFDGSAAGDAAVPALSAPGLGDDMAGAPAVALRPGPGGRRLAVLPLPANDVLLVLDADRGTVLRTIPLGVEPIAAAISASGAVAYVSILGGRKPSSGDRSSRQCCDPRAEAVRIDARGIAEAGSVARVDLVNGRVTREITVGRHPTAVVWDEARGRLYVADGNSDLVSVVDTRSDRVVLNLDVRPFRERTPGVAPTALALAPGGNMLYVALGGANAVAQYAIAADGSATLGGLVPTAWYPNALDVSADGKYLAVGALLGVGSGVGRAGGSPGKVGRYVHAVRGAVSVLAIPTTAELSAFTTAVARNDRLTPAISGAPIAELAARARVAPRAIPERPGEPTPISHVVFIVRENRTFDQVLGDGNRGNRDSSLVIFGRSVTPNAHALARQFVTLDHFFASGGNSADGHQWLTQANETEYPMWPLYFGRTYPSEGNDPLAYSVGGFLWENAQAKGKSVTVFGEYAPAPQSSVANVRDSLFELWRARPADFAGQRETLRRLYHTTSPIPSLDRSLVREYPGWTEETPDVVKAGDILAHLADWERAGRMPALTMVILPNDHTQGTSPGWCTPRACVADNDFALGKLVDGFSHSSFWKSMAIFVVEDDAQDGVDHVDGHRTVALVASPWARRGVVDSTMYVQPSMVKTIELVLGLPAMSMFDLVSTDMRASFIGPVGKPDFTPYTAIAPAQSLFERNLSVGEIQGRHAAARRRAALASSRMRFDGPDEAPSEQLNRILWWDARGWNVKYPGARHSLFFPLSVDVDDRDR